MKSISFPKMFNSNSTKILSDKEATSQNLKNLLMSEVNELSGDPDYGVALRRYFFDQNNYVLRDILIDEIYTKISTFMPQLTIRRKDITITIERATMYVTIKAINNLDFETNMYNIVLLQESED